MSRIYRVPINFTYTAAGGDFDILSIQPADDKPCRLLYLELGQTSEVGDAQEEGVRVTIRHMTATVTIGSGGAAVTPVANRPGTADVAAAGFTARVGDGTVSTTSGTSTIMDERGWNVRNTPCPLPIDDRALPIAIQTEVLIVRAETTLADDMTFSGYALVEEMP
jgi:hypothetical protein